MPAFYRTEPFRALIDGFVETTGGIAAVAYQVRRDPGGRGDWFFTPDSEIPYPHFIASKATKKSSWRTGYPTRADLGLWRDYRPTHIFAAGWDSPLAIAAAFYTRIGNARLGVWVESNATTSTRRGRGSDAFRKAFLSSASFVVVPTPGSRRFVEELVGPMVSAELKNPVSCQRLTDSSVAPARRMIFLGDFSRRKGFDRFCEILRTGAGHDWSGVCWGRDVEGLAAAAPPNLTVEASRPLASITGELSDSDVLVVPSRVDPAPLTYSEALALGLRVMVSCDIAYAEDAERWAGSAAFDPVNPAGAIEIAERLLQGPRPSKARGAAVSPEQWARGVLECMVPT
ncbi:MAG: glycosyltransferase [Nocardioides sp.]|uniref:glycosyltransferase n=1 Tax=Nocardioides sp. TaxID=35761 RepID=UPI0039E54FCC